MTCHHIYQGYAGTTNTHHSVFLVHVSGHARSGLAALSRTGNPTKRKVSANSYTQEMEMSQEIITCVRHYLATFFLLISLSGNYGVACLPVQCSN